MPMVSNIGLAFVAALFLASCSSTGSQIVYTPGSSSAATAESEQTPEQLEQARQQAAQERRLAEAREAERLAQAAEAAEREAEREEANKTINKFLQNVESRIYAQISKNLVDSMFEENGALTGTAELEGATIYWVKDVTAGTITVTITEEDGTITELVVPLTGFGF